MARNVTYRRVSTAVVMEQLPGDQVERIAWWYCGLSKPRSTQTQPSVLVEFRRIHADGQVSGASTDSILRGIPLTALGLVRIGTVWQNKRCVREAIFQIKEYDVEFREGAWRFASFHSNATEGLEEPYPISLHSPPYRGLDRNRLIEFSLRSGGRLVIPCLEYFARCYGRSGELRRVLATYPWDGQGDTCVNRFYAPIDEQEEPQKVWKVNLRRRMINGDVVFLAHCKYDPYTTRAARSIHAQLESHFANDNTRTAFLNVGPWFQGPAQLKVAGWFFGGEKSFLGLRVLGGSDPAGILIERDRENTNQNKRINSDGVTNTAWTGVPTRLLVKSPEIVSIVDEDPDNRSSSVEVEDIDFEVLGDERIVREVRRRQARTSGGKKGNGDSVAVYSGGEPCGSGKGVGSSVHNQRAILESRGILRDMWDAMRHLQRKYPKSISAVQWYTFQDGFQSSGEPSTISLEQFSDAVLDLKKEIRNWVYLDRRSGIVRGILVARMIVHGQKVDFFEIQRRPRKKKSVNNEERDGEENYKGFACILETDDIHSEWVKTFLSTVRYAKGIVSKLTKSCPGLVETFNHASTKDDEVSCEKTVLNALWKINGIDLINAAN